MNINSILDKGKKTDINFTCYASAKYPISALIHAEKVKIY